MTNSYGFSGDIPDDAIAGLHDNQNGEWTGSFYFSQKDAKHKEELMGSNDTLSIEEVNDSGWVGAK
jgi:hypothetical protein